MSKKHLINGFIVVVLSLILVDALPRTSLAHQRLKDAVDPILDVTGLWQESWRLFAPEVDKVNVWITARITYADGSSITRRSPDWTKMSALERFLRFREMEFVDSIRMDSSRGAWPGFADYMARTVLHPAKPELKAIEVVLTRQWAVVPPPMPGLEQAFPSKSEETGSFVFYTKRYP